MKIFTFNKLKSNENTTIYSKKLLSNNDSFILVNLHFVDYLQEFKLKQVINTLKNRKMKTQIKAQKDLYNAGKCFTKGHIYSVNRYVSNEPGLMEAQTINDMGEAHIIGSWWRNFKIVK